MTDPLALDQGSVQTPTPMVDPLQDALDLNASHEHSAHWPPTPGTYSMDDEDLPDDVSAASEAGEDVLQQPDVEKNEGQELSVQPQAVRKTGWTNADGQLTSQQTGTRQEEEENVLTTDSGMVSVLSFFLCCSISPQYFALFVWIKTSFFSVLHDKIIFLLEELLSYYECT